MPHPFPRQGVPPGPSLARLLIHHHRPIRSFSFHYYYSTTPTPPPNTQQLRFASTTQNAKPSPPTTRRQPPPRNVLKTSAKSPKTSQDTVIAGLEADAQKETLSSTPEWKEPLEEPKEGEAAPEPSQIDLMISTLPERMRPYASTVRGAPVSHVTAFLVLHELTAIIPLLFLVGLFHFGIWMPLDYMSENWESTLGYGILTFERYFKRKGWFGFSENKTYDEANYLDDGEENEEEDLEEVLEKYKVDSKYKLLVEVGLAWTITKLLLPVRIAVSVWMTPMFARVLVRAQSVFKRKPKIPKTPKAS